MRYVTLYIDSHIDGPQNPTSAALHAAGVYHEVIDVNSMWHPNTLRDVLAANGFPTLPVLVSSAGAWSGHIPELIEPLHRLRVLDPRARIVTRGGTEIKTRNGRKVIARMKITQREEGTKAADYSLRDKIQRDYMDRTRGMGKPRT